MSSRRQTLQGGNRHGSSFPTSFVDSKKIFLRVSVPLWLITHTKTGRTLFLMNIVLLGYRGTGKSTIARLLAKQLDRKLVSIDELIVKSAGMPVPRIVSEWGWPRFREIESQMVREVAAKEDRMVIDCGGGVVLDEDNIRLL